MELPEVVEGEDNSSPVKVNYKCFCKTAVLCNGV